MDEKNKNENREANANPETKEDRNLARRNALKRMAKAGLTVAAAIPLINTTGCYEDYEDYSDYSNYGNYSGAYGNYGDYVEAYSNSA